MLNHRVLKRPTAFHLLESVWQECLQKLYWTSWPISCKQFWLNHSLFYCEGCLDMFLRDFLCAWCTWCTPFHQFQDFLFNTLQSRNLGMNSVGIKVEGKDVLKVSYTIDSGGWKQFPVLSKTYSWVTLKKSWYQQTAQSSLNKLLSILWHNRLP